MVLVGDAEGAAEIFRNKTAFGKPIEDYGCVVQEERGWSDAQELTAFPPRPRACRALKFFGTNVLVTEGHEWKRQRRLTAPSFSEVRRVARAQGVSRVVVTCSADVPSSG